MVRSLSSLSPPVLVLGSVVAVFRSPGWPVEGGPADPHPVYSQSKTLTEVQSSS